MQLLDKVQRRTVGGGADNRHGDGGSSASSGAFVERQAPGGSGEAAGRKVPGLPLARLTAAGARANDGGDSAPQPSPMADATQRSAWRARDPATARGVELVVDGGVTARGAHGRRAAAALQEEGQDGEQGTRSSGGAMERGGSVSDDASVEVIPPARGGKHAEGLTEEEQEERQAAKGRSKAAAWLESGFAAVHKGSSARHATEDLPGTVAGAGSASQASASDVGEDPKGHLARAMVAADGPEAAVGAGHASMSDATSGAVDGAHLVGDFARGKRLRKLLRLLSSATTVRIVRMFRLRMMGLALGVLLVHAAAFAAMLALLARDEAHIKELGAAGVRE